MNNFFRSKSIRLALVISIFLLLLVILLSPSKKASPVLTPTPLPQTDRLELIDLSKEKRQQAIRYTSSIEKKLPLYKTGLSTSVGIEISLNIYRLPDDPGEVVRLEIYGLSYLNQETDPKKNPNVTAFKEGYLKAMELLESQNIDPKKLIFIYGDKEYVRKTTIIWLNALKLEP